MLQALRIADIRQGMYRFDDVRAQRGEDLVRTFQLLLGIAGKRAARDFGVPEVDLFVIRFDPWRNADGTLRFEMAVGPILTRLGRGLGKLSGVEAPKLDDAASQKRRERNRRKAAKREARA